MNYEIYILTIERNKDRYNNVIKQLKDQNLSYKLFFGIDFKSLSKNQLKKFKSSWGIITPDSVSCCAISHILLWNYISKQKNIDYVIILEDDSVLIKDKFIEYQSYIEDKINDNNFINLSKGFHIKYSSDYSKLWTRSHMILGLDTYIVTPGLCRKLFNFYYENGISYHIDLHLGFVKDYIGLELWHFNILISKSTNLRSKTSMNSHENKFILKFIEDKEIYKLFKTPIIQINNNIIDTITIFYIVFIIIFIILVFNRYNYNIYYFGFILGCIIYDIL